MTINKPTKPNITIPASFALNGVKNDFDNDKLVNGFNSIDPDVLPGDVLNKLIDDLYQGTNYAITAMDVLNLIEDGETIIYKDGIFQSGKAGGTDLPLFTPMAMPKLLTGDETLGWGLQGSQHTRAVYETAYDALATALASGTATTDTILISNINSVNVTKTVDCKLYNGMRVVDVANVAQVNDLYSATGSQPYFVVDAVNQTFTLPKNENAIRFTTDTAKGGLYNKDQIANITGNISSPTYALNYQQTTYSGVFKATSNGGFASAQPQGSSPKNIDFNASNVVNTGTEVQGRSVNHFLYYKIGNTVVNEALVDVGNLQAEIDLKADKDLSNIDAQGKEYVASLGMPSSSYIDLTLGASGSTYTAPANGYVYFEGTSTSSTTQLDIYNTNKTLGLTQWYNASGVTYRLSLPIKKGETFIVNYTNVNKVFFRFIYAEGEV